MHDEPQVFCVLPYVVGVVLNVRLSALAAVWHSVILIGTDPIAHRPLKTRVYDGGGGDGDGANGGCVGGGKLSQYPSVGCGGSGGDNGGGFGGNDGYLAQMQGAIEEQSPSLPSYGWKLRAFCISELGVNIHEEPQPPIWLPCVTISVYVKLRLSAAAWQSSILAGTEPGGHRAPLSSRDAVKVYEGGGDGTGVTNGGGGDGSGGIGGAAPPDCNERRAASGPDGQMAS